MRLSNLALDLGTLTGSDAETATCVRVLTRNEWDEKAGKYDVDKVVGYTYRCRANCNQEGQEDFFDVQIEGNKNAEEIIRAVKDHGKAEVRFEDLAAKAYGFLGKDNALITGVKVTASVAAYEAEILL